MTTRRDVMMGGAALAAASAMPAFAAGQAERLRPQSPLGVAQTALGHYFRKVRGDSPGARGPADPFATADYVRSLGAGGIQMAIPPDTDVKKLRARLERNNLFFEGDIRLIEHPGDDTSAFEKGLRMYKELGAPCVRTVCFVGRRYEKFTSLQEYKDWRDNALAVLDVCVPIADKVGIPLAMENHKDRVVDEEVAVLKKYSSPQLRRAGRFRQQYLDVRRPGGCHQQARALCEVLPHQEYGGADLSPTGSCCRKSCSRTASWTFPPCGRC